MTTDNAREPGDPRLPQSGPETPDLRDENFPPHIRPASGEDFRNRVPGETHNSPLPIPPAVADFIDGGSELVTMAQADLLPAIGWVASYRSEPCGALLTALARAQGEFEQITMDGAVDFVDRQNRRIAYRYASLASIHAATRPALARYGLATTHVTEIRYDANGLPAAYTLTTTLHHGEQWLKTALDVPYEPDPKSMASLFTYYRRYSVLNLLDLYADAEDHETSLDIGERVAQREEKRRQAAVDLDRTKKSDKAARSRVDRAMAAQAPLPEDTPQPDPTDDASTTQSDAAPTAAPYAKGQGMSENGVADWLTRINDAANFTELAAEHQRAARAADGLKDEAAKARFYQAFVKHPKYIAPTGAQTPGNKH